MALVGHKSYQCMTQRGTSPRVSWLCHNIGELNSEQPIKTQITYPTTKMVCGEMSDVVNGVEPRIMG